MVHAEGTKKYLKKCMGIECDTTCDGGDVKNFSEFFADTRKKIAKNLMTLAYVGGHFQKFLMTSAKASSEKVPCPKQTWKV